MQNLIKKIAKGVSNNYKFVRNDEEGHRLGKTLYDADLHHEELAAGMRVIHQAFQGAYTDDLIFHSGLPRHMISPEGKKLVRGSLDESGTGINYHDTETDQKHRIPVKNLLGLSINHNLRKVSKQLRTLPERAYNEEQYDAPEEQHKLLPMQDKNPVIMHGHPHLTAAEMIRKHARTRQEIFGASVLMGLPTVWHDSDTGNHSELVGYHEDGSPLHGDAAGNLYKG